MKSVSDLPGHRKRITNGLGIHSIGSLVWLSARLRLTYVIAKEKSEFGVQGQLTPSKFF